MCEFDVADAGYWQCPDTNVYNRRVTVGTKMATCFGRRFPARNRDAPAARSIDHQDAGNSQKYQCPFHRPDSTQSAIPLKK